MREIKYIVFHCTATPTNTTVESIQRYWRVNLGWRNPGYHFIIERNGNIVKLHPVERVANGVRGYNANSIHISYIGGVDAIGRARDNRTYEQKVSQLHLLEEMRRRFPHSRLMVRGHNDFPNVKKACPSYSVKEWLDSLKI